MVLYMSSSFWLLVVESRDFSHAEKERIAGKAEKIHKMTPSFTQNGPKLWFWVKTNVILGIYSVLQAVLFSQLEKNPVTQLPTAKN